MSIHKAKEEREILKEQRHGISCQSVSFMTPLPFPMFLETQILRELFFKGWLWEKKRPRKNCYNQVGVLHFWSQTCVYKKWNFPFITRIHFSLCPFHWLAETYFQPSQASIPSPPTPQACAQAWKPSSLLMVLYNLWTTLRCTGDPSIIGRWCHGWNTISRIGSSFQTYHFYFCFFGNSSLTLWPSLTPHCHCSRSHVGLQRKVMHNTKRSENSMPVLLFDPTRRRKALKLLPAYWIIFLKYIFKLLFKP